ncbi:MAG: hypothetical protein QM783_07120 [Phycisphaerales bacterium]
MDGTDAEHGLEVVAPAAAQSLRGALAEALGAIRANTLKPLQFSRDLGLDKSLGWKVSRFVGEEDAVVAFRHLPGRSGMKIVVDRLAASGVPDAMLKRIGTALDDLDKVIEKHAGNRDTFDLMMASLSPQLAKERHEEFRRMAFQGNSATWGVQARLQLAIHAVAPSATTDTVDLAISAGLIDLRRLRPEVSWAVARSWRFSDTGETLNTLHQRPIDPAAPKDSLPIMTTFSTSPLPPMVARRETERPIVRYELEPGPIGNTGACTCVTGWYDQGVESIYRTETDVHGEHAVSLSTPAEALYFELYVHKDMTFAHNPTVHVYSQLPGGPTYPRDGINGGKLEIPLEIVRLGGGRTAPSTVNPEYTKHRELVEATVGALGRPLTEYIGFRVRMAYPPIPALAVFRYELPTRP